MATRVIANCGQLKINWSGPTRTWANIYGMIGLPTLPVFDQALANALFTSIAAALPASGLASLLADTVILESISIRSLNSANQPEFVGTGTPVGGGGVGDMLPLSVAACVTLRTAQAGKSFRGRSYISGFTETQNDANGRISTAANTAAQSWVQQIVGALGTHNMGMAVLSFARDAATIPAKTVVAKPGFGNTVTALLVRNTKWESQRRRTGRE